MRILLISNDLRISVKFRIGFIVSGLYLTVEFRFSRAKITVSAGLKALAQRV
jgi:hypothetical protein